MFGRPQQPAYYSEYPPPQNQRQRSMSPLDRTGEELSEIRTTTHTLTKEMKVMRKLIEDMQMSLNEKDAEIIRLNMHLGDEKKKTALNSNERQRQHSFALGKAS